MRSHSLGGQRLPSLGIVLVLVGAAAVVAISSPPAGAGGTEVKLQRSGPLRYVTLSDRQGPGALELQVECPVGTRLASGGGALGKVGNAAHFSGFVPRDTGDLDGDGDDGFILRGSRNGLIGDTSIKLVAICLGPGQDSLAYAEQGDVVSEGTLSAANAHSCPTGSRLTGLGFESDGPSSQVKIVGLAADLQGGAIDPFEMVWQYRKSGASQAVTSHVICLAPGFAPLRYAIARRTFPNESTRVLKAHCPGKSRAIGGGVGSAPTNVLASLPFDDRDRNKVPDDGWLAKVFNYFDPPAEYVQAFCLGRRTP